MQDAHHILKKYWGHSSFRPLQEPVIEKLLEQKNVLALMPTGGGKSLCFQIPALMQEGICIVVSPLVALMEDQVNALQQKGIKAMALTGGMTYRDLDAALDNCIYGNYKFLYLSPERLQQDLVQERIKLMNVNLIAVDEAHCISQWGHDFRPAYRNISQLKDLKPSTPFIALTATATPGVVKDIVKELELENIEVLKDSFYRANLAYNVLKAEDKYYRLDQLLNNKNEPAIIYVRSRKASLEIADLLNKKNFKADAFHGGLQPKEKTKRLSDWLENKHQIMVATTAFGMGIDKADVRQVIHLNLPESLESYFQEAGRAGRDGKKAIATILTNKSDIPILKNQFLANLPQLEDVKLVYKKLNTYFRIAYGEGEQTEHNFSFSEFCAQYELPFSKTYEVLQLLDRCSVLKLSKEFHKKTSIHFTVSGKQLQFYLDQNQKYENFVKALLRTYGGILENKTNIDLASVCKKSNTDQRTALKYLEELEKVQVLEYVYAEHDATVLFLVPREDDSVIFPLAPYIKQHNKSKKEKIDAVLSYLENDKICRSKQLLAYFGEEKTENCGICSVCQKQIAPLTRELKNAIYLEIMKVLKTSKASSRELTEAINYPEDQVLEVLRLLLDKELISRESGNSYKINN
ncbi:RecQ family ATP-dependent DNA helicase [Salegentibacter mishustinae]|uniref:ATP-dependent DNA helicase RecQ n=1 Tax=Salegentibacter mishustinae TaxID=270918 RepID=A0A0Q9ZEJ6_9FLAO|nr:ATP-dependent DNA helicase RecQ [Salegentibacter mishustinae]KRG27121.1 recombinase RecQ [Salegentibacter mishustinae]PNW21354.1 recombinase RecQ [Salegentibacter mishustinae]PZX62707.1 ATP-dependent DNA helicase RecQ [Salegentibacter mishustinae]GGW97715.1 ATP-dependent DNA helicase RecQ2 [Salegentibacter mishustinae]